MTESMYISWFSSDIHNLSPLIEFGFAGNAFSRDPGATN